jgi:hypothetical protein
VARLDSARALGGLTSRAHPAGHAGALLDSARGALAEAGALLDSHAPRPRRARGDLRRSSILRLKGDRLGRVGGRFAGEKPGEFVAPHGCVVDSRRDLYVAEVSWTAKGSLENPPREVRSLQKFALS